MTNRELLYIKTIAEEQSISKAAKKIHIAQPSLSQAVMRIEDSLGAPLFNRTPLGLKLTCAGERYYQAATQILKIYDDLEAELSDMNNLKTGRINLGITNHLGTVLLPDILSSFCAKYPNVEIQVTEASSTELDQKLLSGEIDFSILHTQKERQQSSFSYEVLSQSPFVIALSPEHPLIEKAKLIEGYPFPVIDVRYLKKESFIMLDPRQRIRQVMDSILKKAGITQPHIKMTLRNFETAHLLACRGVGLTLLPLDYIPLTACDHSPAYLCLDHKYDTIWDLCITVQNGHYLSKADQVFLQMIRDYFPTS